MNWLLLRWQLLLAFFHVFHVELGAAVAMAIAVGESVFE